MAPNSSSNEGNKVDKLVTKARLDDIMRDVRTTGLAWADLREQYSPKHSAFAPLNFAASTWATYIKAGITELDSDLATDEIYSQAATMAAYGVELLRIALSGSQIHRRQIIQVGNMLGALCTALSDTRDRHRDTVTKTFGDKVDAYKRSQCASGAVEPDDAASLEHAGQSSGSKSPPET
ncbi:hypothetical protein FBU31_006445, partial [Coemansia sp. 'formosensis']